MSAFAVSIISGASTSALAEAPMSGIQQRHETPAITKQHDNAALSPAAKALQLYKEGESVPTIAKELEISVVTVDSYLKISVQTAPTVQTPSTATATVSAVG